MEISDQRRSGVKRMVVNDNQIFPAERNRHCACAGIRAMAYHLVKHTYCEK